jgi:hydroxymethylpyrimidine/phosphomethylpyrimidine kinase
MSRQAAPVEPPVVLTIAGSDSGGGAGIQADLKTVEACGGFGTSAITSVTAQNTRGVEGTHGVPISELEAQIDAVLGDFDVAAVKTGMLGTSEVVETVVDYAEDLPNLVVDPVMVAASGDRLLRPEAEAAYEDLLAAATLVTPNADEAEVLTDVTVSDVDGAREAGERILEMGAEAALVKGGHVPGDDVVDVLVTESTMRTFRHGRVDTEATHGSGCTLSSAIATSLAHGDDLASAVGEGVSLLASAVRYGLDVGEGPGAVHHLVQIRNEAAREDTRYAVDRIVGELADRDATALVPPDGTNVAGATPFAESPRDVAGAEGGIAPTREGPRTNRGVRFGAAGRVGSLLLAVREVDQSARFALDCRHTAAVSRALSELPGQVLDLSGGDVTVDGRPADADADERALERRVSEAATEGGGAPLAVVHGARGPDRVTLLAPTAETLLERAGTALAALET